MAKGGEGSLKLVGADTERRLQPGVPARSADLTSPADHLNQMIVRMLEEDGRRPFAEIAAALDVSEGTIRNRVNGMRQAGQMRIVAIVDPGAVEYETDAMLGIKVAPSATPAQVASRLGDLQEVVYILWVSGRYDLLVEIVSEERDELTRFLEQHIHGTPDIAEVETMTGLRSFKNQFLLKRNWK
jgi:Lrp/AsnC family transcriptional regulator for asnA, asnC and gidA